MLYPLARSALFKLDAERSHELTLSMLSRLPGVAGLLMGQPRVAGPARVMGLDFANRVGLAAGLDKNGECLAAWEQFGFGFIEVGTVTPRAQPGNPRPRMFRLPEHQAIINRLGFNNHGMEALASRLEQTRHQFKGVLGVNIGKNADTPIERAAEDYVLCLQRLHRHADYVTVNISSPNTPGLRALSRATELERMLTPIVRARAALSKPMPLLLKVSPDDADARLRDVAQVVRGIGLEGIVATNTTTSRAGLPERAQRWPGGASGPTLAARSDEVLALLRAELGDALVLVGVGGVDSAARYQAKLRAGATLVQAYTGFIYEGPTFVRKVLAR